MSELDWKGTNQKAYQDLFNLEADRLSRALLAYRCGMTPLDSLPTVISTENATANKLPFEDFQFDLAISTYPFFSMKESHDSSLQQLRELIRVAREVRLAPHLLEQEDVSKKLGPLMLVLQQEEVGVEVTPLSEKQGFAHAVMIKLWAQSCRVK
jgi:hypothetical protein